MATMDGFLDKLKSFPGGMAARLRGSTATPTEPAPVEPMTQPGQVIQSEPVGTKAPPLRSSPPKPTGISYTPAEPAVGIGAGDPAQNAARLRSSEWASVGGEPTPRTGAISPEGRAWQAEQAKPWPAAEPVQPAKPGLGARFNAAAGKTLPGLGGALAVGAEALDPNVQAAVNPDSGMPTTDRLKQGARSALRTGGGILGAAGGAALGAGPVTGFLGAVPGGAAGYAAGDWVADKLVGKAQQPAPVAQPIAQQPVTPATQAPDLGTFKNGVKVSGDINNGNTLGDIAASMPTNQGVRTPEQVATGTAVPDKGFGMIRNNQTGETTQIGMRKPAQPAQPTGQGTSTTEDYQTPLGVRPGSMNDIALRERFHTRRATQELARAQLGYTMGKDARDFADKQQDKVLKATDEEIGARAAERVGKGGLFTNEKDRQAAVTSEKAQQKRVYDRSIAAAGKDPRTMGFGERKQLHQFMDIRDKVLEGRDSLMDYFGNHQIDSDNAYAFAPARVEPAIRPGEPWIIHTQNGNQIPIKAFQGGQFNIWGANKPVNADFAALVKPLIEAKQKKQAKGK